MEVNLCRDAEASGSLDPDFTQCVWELETLETTQRLGQHLAKQLPRGSILLLQGELGAGKTSLVQGLALACGITEAITSPTFALAQHYPDGNPPLVHLDLYRLDAHGSADELFLQEEEEARARKRARRAISIYLPIENYHRAWMAQGFDRSDFSSGGSDRFVDELVAWGSVEKVRRRLADYREMGVDEVILIPLNADSTSGPDVAVLRELLAE